MSVKHERDSAIRKIFTKHNLGPIPDAPFTNDVAMNLTNRTKARLSNLEDDLQDKKVTILIICILEYSCRSEHFYLKLFLIYIFQNHSQNLYLYAVGHIASVLYSASHYFAILLPFCFGISVDA